MKALAPLFLLFTALSFGQIQNRPELTAPLLQIFIQEAEMRGVEVLLHLAELDSLNVRNTGDWTGAEYSWRGNISSITIRPDAFQDPESNKALFIFLHEVGHHFGIDDCYQCRYNLFSANYSARAVLLMKDPFIKKLLLDNFFERIQEPKAKHKHF